MLQRKTSELNSGDYITNIAGDCSSNIASDANTIIC